MRNFLEFNKIFSTYLKILTDKSARQQLVDGDLQSSSGKKKFPVPDDKALLFVSDALTLLPDSRIFYIEDSIKKLLTMTKIPRVNSNIKLPFENVFIDVEFDTVDIDALLDDEIKKRRGILKVGNLKIIGILLRRGYLHKPDTEEQVGTDLRISVAMTYSGAEGEHVMVHTFARDVDVFKEFTEDVNVKLNENEDYYAVNEAVFRFVIAFLNFLNDPDVRVIESEHSADANVKRIKKGKIAIPKMSLIRLDGKLRVYVDSLKMGKHFEYSYRFWVRGHFRTLRHERYGDNVGKRVWILPFLKGKGVLIDRNYIVEKED